MEVTKEHSISLESSGLTHNYTQVKTLFVHTRIKLLNRKTKVVGAGLHSTSFISWSLGGSVNPTIASQTLPAMLLSPLPQVTLTVIGPPGEAHTSTQMLRGLHSPLLLHFSAYMSNGAFTFICSLDPHNTPVR